MGSEHYSQGDEDPYSLQVSFQQRSSNDSLTGLSPQEAAEACPGEGMDLKAPGLRSDANYLPSLQHRAALEILAACLPSQSEVLSDENLFLTAFAAFISRLTRQDVVEVAIGRGELVRFNFEGDCSFRSALGQVSHRRRADAEQVAESIRQQGTLYEFWFESGPASGPLSDTGSETITSHPDCGLRLILNNEGMFELASPSGLWADAPLRSWLDYLSNMLECAADNPDAPISRLALWRDADARAFYAALNATRVQFDGPTSIPARIVSSLGRRADAVAVISAGMQYTYRELDARSTQLALELVSSGAGPNRAVAVCMERSADLPLALLAVLKSGSYYVPLDPHNPSLRLRGILDECKPVALISDTRTAGTIRDALDSSLVSVLLVDKMRAPSASAGGIQELPPPPALSDLAYTIYTSGTTGKPKGVRITRRALHNLVCAMIERSYKSVETDRTLAVAPISFDIATMDMFVPLCSGGTLVVASRRDATDPERIAELVKQHDITCLQATPATWRMLVGSGWQGKRDLKMLSGGEALPRELANDLLKLGSELWNCYGPTETTIYSAVNRIYPDPGIVTVGSPIANTSFYVMDKGGNPVPPGIPGELYIGGLGVSPGYVARPELTAQRFVADRFGDWGKVSGQVSQPTYFCTGDLVRLVTGNEFEFFGRLDHQVKLRGFRIELGEIESVLRNHSSLSDAVVILREDTPGEPRLVAYVLSSSELGGADQIGASALRDYAAKSLPEYMLPSVIVTLDSYPLSNSGKIDRKALPAPETVPERVAPDLPVAKAASGELEAKLLKIFQEVLHNDQIGVTDSFFRFGGYSLLTVRLFSRIDRELHVRLPISLLFDAPTVRELAKIIKHGSAPSTIVPVRPHGRLAPIFIVQSYLLYGAMLEIVENERPVFGVREIGDEKEPISIEDRAGQFAREILDINPDAPIYLAGWCAAGTLTVEIARQLRVAGHSVGFVALFDAERPGFAPPRGLKAWFSRLWRKTVFHANRILGIPWSARYTYLYEAMLRNWDWAVESYYTAHYNTMLWLQKRLGVSLSEAAFNNVYANISALKDYSVRPYDGKLNLYRAADIPNVSGIDETLGWGTVALEGVDVDFVPGDHVSMFKKPNISVLADRLQYELRKSELNHRTQTASSSLAR